MTNAAKDCVKIIYYEMMIKHDKNGSEVKIFVYSSNASRWINQFIRLFH
jgi:hypothetical protein